jgi:hypothetical protein
MSLNPEPAAPDERAEYNLPPKSYAEAAEVALEPESHANNTDGTLEQGGKRLKSKIEDLKTTGIQTPPDDDKQSLEGVGQTPRSPTIKGHRRVASRGSHGSLGRKYGEQMQNELLEKHPDGNGHALASVKPLEELEKVPGTDLKRRNSELKSGRQAGAGWATSKYVHTTILSRCLGTN